MQQIAVYASRRLEVQTITTSADGYPGVQEISLSSAIDKPLTGNFTLRFPEVQTIQVIAELPSQLDGAFILAYNYFDFSVSPSMLVARTQCISVTASAEEVKAALESLSPVDEVEVVRSGYGGFLDSFGFTWSVTFSGMCIGCMYKAVLMVRIL